MNRALTFLGMFHAARCTRRSAYCILHAVLLLTAFGTHGQALDSFIQITDPAATDLMMIQTNSAGAAGQKRTGAISLTNLWQRFVTLFGAATGSVSSVSILSNSYAISSPGGTVTNAFKRFLLETNQLHQISNILSARIAGDVVELGAGRFDPTNRWVVPVGVTLIGQGDATEIVYRATLNTNGCQITISSSNRVGNFKIIPSNTNWFQAAVGFNEAIGDRPATNAFLYNINAPGYTDSFYFWHNSMFDVRMFNCQGLSKGDSLVKMSTSGLTNYVEAVNCKFHSDMRGQAVASMISAARATPVRTGGGLLRLINCDGEATNANISTIVLVETENARTEIYGGSYRWAGTNSAYFGDNVTYVPSGPSFSPFAFYNSHVQKSDLEPGSDGIWADSDFGQISVNDGVTSGSTNIINALSQITPAAGDKIFALDISAATLGWIPYSGFGGGASSNANQFGAAGATYTLKDGLRTTNLTEFGKLAVTNTANGNHVSIDEDSVFGSDGLEFLTLAGTGISLDDASNSILPANTPRPSFGSQTFPFNNVVATNVSAERTITLEGVTALRPAFINGSGQLTNASGTPDGTKFMRDDGVLAVPSGLGGGTNYPTPVRIGTNITVGVGVRQSVTLSTNATFILNFQGTPLNGESVRVAVSNLNTAAIWMTNFQSGSAASFFDPYVGSNVTATAIAGSSIRYFEFEASTNFQANGSARWELKWSSEKQPEIAVASAGGNGFLVSLTNADGSIITHSNSYMPQAASMVLSNLVGLASTVFTNVPLGGTNISRRTEGGTNFFDTTGYLNNWSLYPTSVLASPGPFFSTNIANVRMAPYNAVGDGVTDDTLALSNALRQPIVYVPSGRYLVDPLFIYSKEVFGDGPNSVIASRSNVIGTILARTVAPHLGGAGGARIRGIRFNGNTNLDFNISSSPNAVIGLQHNAKGGWGGVVEDCFFEGFYKGLWLVGTNNIGTRENSGIYGRNWFTNCNSAIYTGSTNEVEFVLVTENQIRKCYLGFENLNAANITFSENVIIDCAGIGIKVEPISLSTVDRGHSWYNDNTVIHNGSAINFQHADLATVRGGAYEGAITLASCTNVVLADFFWEVSGNGLVLAGGQANEVRDIRMTPASSTNMSGWNGVNCRFRNNRRSTATGYDIIWDYSGSEGVQASIILGVGGANTNFTGQAADEAMFIDAGTTNVNFVAVMPGLTGRVFTPTYILTNLTATDRTLSFSAVTNRWVGLGQYAGISAPLTITNKHTALLELTMSGTNAYWAFRQATNGF